MTIDLVNGVLEIGGALVVLLNIRQVLRDRMVRGVHWGPTIFFTVWGVWNLYYYPSLHQPISALGAGGLVVVNLVWLALARRFSRRPESRGTYEINWGSVPEESVEDMRRRIQHQAATIRGHGSRVR